MLEIPSYYLGVIVDIVCVVIPTCRSGSGGGGGGGVISGIVRRSLNRNTCLLAAKDNKGHVQGR